MDDCANLTLIPSGDKYEDGYQRLTLVPDPTDDDIAAIEFELANGDFGDWDDAA